MRRAMRATFSAGIGRRRPQIASCSPALAHRSADPQFNVSIVKHILERLRTAAITVAHRNYWTRRGLSCQQHRNQKVDPLVLRYSYAVRAPLTSTQKLPLAGDCVVGSTHLQDRLCLWIASMPTNTSSVLFMRLWPIVRTVSHDLIVMTSLSWLN